MTNYISREALFKSVEDYASTHPVMNDNELFALFCSIPAADARLVVRAEFVRCGDGKSVPFMCTHCGKTVPANLVEIWGANFCPNCGAEMKGEADGN